MRSPTTIGAVLPSSRELSKSMLEGLDLGPDTPVLEFGPGTGAFTAAIADLVDSGVPIPYLGIERDLGMYRRLERHFPALSFVHDNVSHVREICAQQKFGPAAVVVCGLPLVLMESASLDALLSDAKSCMRSGAVFRAFSYAHCYPLKGAVRVRRLLAETFGQAARTAVVFSNVPPAIVLEAIKAQPHGT